MKFPTAVNDEADRLLSQGYRVTSRKHCGIARIDCDPVTYAQRMEEQDTEGSPEDHHTPRWYEYYRRVITTDRLTVSQAVSHCMATKTCWSVCSFTQAFAHQGELVQDEVAIELRPLLTIGRRLVRDLELLSTTIQANPILKTSALCCRINIACQRKAHATRWLITALEERISGGQSVNAETSTLRTITAMMDTLTD